MKHTSNEFTNECTNERCNEHTNEQKSEHTNEQGIQPSKMKTVYFLFQNRPNSRRQIFIMAPHATDLLIREIFYSIRHARFIQMR